LLSAKFSDKKTLYETVAVTLNIFVFVYVHLFRIANNLKKISKMSTLPLLDKYLRTRLFSNIQSTHWLYFGMDRGWKSNFIGVGRNEWKQTKEGKHSTYLGLGVIAE